MENLNYISTGTGTALVFQHGLTANIMQTESLLGGFPGVQLLSIDCPGHGKSQLPDDYLISFNSYADELIQFLEKQDIEQAVFGGISMGSGIAINIALRYPEKVKGLILVRPAWLSSSDPENLQILLPAARLMNEHEGRAKFMELPVFKAIDLEPVAQSILGVFASDQQPILEKVIDRMVGDRPFTAMDQLAEIKVPTLVLGNEHDPLHPFEMAEKIHQEIPGSALDKITSRYIDNEQHSIEVRASIEKFLKHNNLY